MMNPAVLTPDAAREYRPPPEPSSWQKNPSVNKLLRFLTAGLAVTTIAGSTNQMSYQHPTEPAGISAEREKDPNLTPDEAYDLIQATNIRIAKLQRFGHSETLDKDVPEGEHLAAVIKLPDPKGQDVRVFAGVFAWVPSDKNSGEYEWEESFETVLGGEGIMSAAQWRLEQEDSPVTWVENGAPVGRNGELVIPLSLGNSPDDVPKAVLGIVTFSSSEDKTSRAIRSVRIDVTSDGPQVGRLDDYYEGAYAQPQGD